jgi:hypothetical protein
LDVSVSAACENEFDNELGAHFRCYHKRRAASIIPYAEVDAWVLQEKPNNVGVGSKCGLVQRGLMGWANSIDVGAICEQLGHNVFVPKSCGPN